MLETRGVYATQDLIICTLRVFNLDKNYLHALNSENAVYLVQRRAAWGRWGAEPEASSLGPRAADCHCTGNSAKERIVLDTYTL